MTEPDALLPCPFCGGSDIRFDEHYGAGRGMHSGQTVWSTCCYNCGATFPNRYRKELLVEAWNTRQPPAPQDDLVEAAVIAAYRAFCLDRRVGDLDFAALSPEGQSQWRGMIAAILPNLKADLDAALAKLAAAEAKGWQDIATAPRDGRKMLLCRVNDKGDYEEWPETFYYEAGEWYSAIDGQAIITKHSYWMPLPAAPEAVGQ